MQTDSKLERELEALKQVGGALEDLDSEAQARVLAWALRRYGAKSQLPLAGDVSPIALRFSPDETPRAEAKFGDLPGLFGAANPKDGPEKALVVAYWLQVISGQETFEGFQVNSELKHLGHGLSNVTATINILMGRKPAQVMQVRKEGKSQQARKKYRLTQAGIDAVRVLLRQPSRQENST